MASKTVRFEEKEVPNTVVSTFKSAGTLSQQERDNMWYSNAEFAAIRSSCKHLSRQLQGSSSARLLEATLQDTLDDKRNVPSIDVSQQMLIRWSRHCASCRGLENWIQGAKGKKDRQEKRRLVVLLVLEAQALEKDCSPDLRAEKLQIVSEKCSAQARIFARRMGIADAVANIMELEQSSRNLNLSRTGLNHFDEMPSVRRDVEIYCNCPPMA